MLLDGKVGGLVFAQTTTSLPRNNNKTQDLNSNLSEQGNC